MKNEDKIKNTLACIAKYMEIMTENGKTTHSFQVNVFNNGLISIQEITRKNYDRKELMEI